MMTYWKSEDAAMKVLYEITQCGYEAAMVCADVSKAQSASAVFEATMARFGRVDCIVNNAGVAGVSRPNMIADVTEAAYDEVFDVNVRGALFMMQAAAQYLQDGGRVINISSAIVNASFAGAALYTASKAALEAFSRILSKEIGPRGITVNALRLGAIIPGMFAKVPPERQAAIASASPFKRLGTPQDAASVVSFLASEAGGWVTGQVITVDGGAT